MNQYLLDSNVLIALAIAEHTDNRRVNAWVESADTCLVSPIPEGSLYRYALRIGYTIAEITTVLAAIYQNSKFHWIPDDLGYLAANWAGVRGHRQVTDVYLAELAQRHGALLATFDQGIAALRPDTTFLIR